MGVKHPAKFSEPVLDRIGEVFEGYGWPRRILDPFAGTGRIHGVIDDTPDWYIDYVPFTVGVEIEPEWAAMHSRTIVASALTMPFPDGTFDGLCTSPCYGSRMADSHNAQDGSVRYSYTHTIGRKLHRENSGQLQWGDAYRQFHQVAWAECLRVLQPGALIVVNVSNHIRAGVEQRVTEWHLNWFLANDCQVVDLERVSTTRLRHGANRDARARYENVFVVRYMP